MKLRLFPFFAVLATTLVALQANCPWTFDKDESAIYRNFLVHYPEQMSNVIGMQGTTVAFENAFGTATASDSTKPSYPRIPPPETAS